MIKGVEKSTLDLINPTKTTQSAHFKLFLLLGLNEAATLKISSILIYSHQEQRIETQKGWYEAKLIKCEIKILASLQELIKKLISE